MTKHCYQKQQKFKAKYIVFLCGMFCSMYVHAISPKMTEDARLNLVLKTNNQLCIYYSDKDFYITGYFVQKKLSIRTNEGAYYVRTQIPVMNKLAGSGVENCIVDTKFFENNVYNYPYTLNFDLKNRNTLLSETRKYTDFCIENKNQQIRLVGVKKQGNQFVCTDKDWQPYKKKGFWARLFGR